MINQYYDMVNNSYYLRTKLPCDEYKPGERLSGIASLMYVVRDYGNKMLSDLNYNEVKKCNTCIKNLYNYCINDQVLGTLKRIKLYYKKIDRNHDFIPVIEKCTKTVKNYH